MKISRPITVLLAMALSGCLRPPVPDAPSRADFSAELIEAREGQAPPDAEPGVCWQDDIRPAVIETVTEQHLLEPEAIAEDGSTRPAVFASETRQSIVEDRATVWFRTPCPDEMTPEFLATVQRALKARGLYLLPLTGVLDAPTRDAIRRYQRSRGLDSDHLSLAAARDLGIVSADRDSL